MLTCVTSNCPLLSCLHARCPVSEGQRWISAVSQVTVDSNGDPVDVEFYSSFWGLQRTFQAPYDAMSPASWSAAVKTIQGVLKRFKQGSVAVAASAQPSAGANQRALEVDGVWCAQQDGDGRYLDLALHAFSGQPCHRAFLQGRADRSHIASTSARFTLQTPERPSSGLRSRKRQIAGNVNI